MQTFPHYLTNILTFLCPLPCETTLISVGFEEFSHVKPLFVLLFSPWDSFFRGKEQKLRSGTAIYFRKRL